MINNNLVMNLQHGFVPGKSWQSNLLSMLSILTDAIEHNLEVDLVFLDFAKAFDSVPHRELIHKLEKYGIWRYGRQQVCITSALSYWAQSLVVSPKGEFLVPFYLYYFETIYQELY